MCAVRVTHNGWVLLHRGEQSNLIDSLLTLLLLYRGGEGEEEEGAMTDRGVGAEVMVEKS